MLKNVLLFNFFCLFSINAMSQNDKMANAQHQLLGITSTNDSSAPHNPHPKAAWFPKAGLGLFIHFGAIATSGIGDVSWVMLANKSWNTDGTMAPNDYYKLMDHWNPQKWNPDELIRRAKEAGFEYAVLTTKHHDGYTLWPSKYGDLGTHTKMNNRDLVKPFVDACRKYGLKVGLYYSPPDWWFDRKYKSWSYGGKDLYDMNHQIVDQLPQKPKNHDQKRKELIAGQVRELLTNYGRVDLIWFDGGNKEISNDEVRSLQPGIIINRRNGEKGDYGDSENQLPGKRFSGWFETCRPMWPIHWWCYVPVAPYDDAATVLTDLIKLRAWGGNLLGNVGPLGDGSIPPQAISAMKEMAIWMKHSEESVKDVTGGNYPEKSTIPVTVKDNVLYAFALPSYLGKMQITANQKPKKAYLLRNKKTIKFEFLQNTITLSIPPSERTLLPDVVKLEF